MDLVYRVLNSSLFRASGVYVIGSFLNVSIPFLLLPILTRYLSPVDYGIISMFSLLLSVFGIFIGLSVHGAINRAYFEKEINFKEYVFNCILILVGSSILTLLISLLFLEFISKVTSVPKNWIPFAVVISFFQFIVSSTLSIYQARMIAKKYAIIQFSQVLINVILSIVFVVLIGWKWEGRILGIAISIVFTGLISIYILKNWIELKFNINYIKHSLKFGIPLIPHSLGGIFMALTDRFIITNLLGIKETGIYTVGLQLGSIVILLADAFNKAYAPWLFKKLEQNDDSIKVKIVKFTYLYFILITIFALLTGYSGPYVTNFLIGKEFFDSAPVILWIALGGAFKGMYYMVINYIFYTHKTHILAWISFSGGMMNIPLTYFFVKRFGIEGAAFSYCMISFIIFVFTWIFSSQVYKMPWIKSNILRRS
ncbi:MAG: oligosaccharide flippase family protein [bacterium]